MPSTPCSNNFLLFPLFIPFFFKAILKTAELPHLCDVFSSIYMYQVFVHIISISPCPLTSSRCSVSQGTAWKTARKKIKNARLEEAKEHLWANFTKGHSGIPGSGIPSDWSVLTDFVNIRA